EGRLIPVRLIMLLTTAALITIGVITIYACEHPDGPDAPPRTDAQQKWQKQLQFVVVGFFAFLAVNFFNYRRFGPLSYWLYGFCIILLITVLFFKPINGAHCWITIPHLPQFQPSEITKLTYIIALAWYLRYRSNYRSFKALIGPFAITLLSLVLILIEPDLGTVMVLLPTLFAILFVAGAKPKHLLIIILMAISLSPFLWSKMEPYQRKRVSSVLLQNDWLRRQAQQHPWLSQTLIGKPTVTNWARAEGYQLLHSKLAVASGGFFGNGWCQGPYIRYNFLPERHNDFIFAVFAHQWGFFGCVVLLLLYAILIACALEIAWQNTDPFGRFITIGITALIAAQAL
ncbi:MAG: FtsW/RodA/SpoVE family cell cycle protein, partial [Sedimentisphaerales bacterium]|nr:FtsW/RodA/SpoVE family cell cycle protein [Sedimentisphaerales bacterium]